MGEENLEAATRMADEVLNEVAREYQEELVPAISRIWDSEIEDLRTDLRGWLRQRAQFAADGEQWQPRYFEFSFGLTRSGDRDPESRSEEAVILDGIRLRGSIDLIEEHASTDSLRIIDHKTGRAPSQPPITLEAARYSSRCFTRWRPKTSSANLSGLRNSPIAPSGETTGAWRFR